MTRYVQFPVPGGPPVIMEAEESDEAASGAVAKGLGEVAQTAVTTAQTTFEDALQGVVGHIARSFVQVVRTLPHPPDEIETTFALTVKGDLGSFVVAKAGGEANYTIRLAWTRGAATGGGDGTQADAG